MLSNDILGLVIVVLLYINAGAPQIETAKEGNEKYVDETKSINQGITTSFTVELEYYEDDNVTTQIKEVDGESIAQNKGNYQEFVIEEITGGFYEEIITSNTKVGSDNNQSTTPTTPLIKSTFVDEVDSTEDDRSNDGPITYKHVAAKKLQEIDAEEFEKATENNADESQDSSDEPEKIYHLQCEDDAGTLVLSGYKKIYFPMIVNNANYVENVSLPTVIKGNFTTDFAACKLVRLSPIMVQVKIYSLYKHRKDFDCPLFPNNTNEERHLELLPTAATRIITLEYLYHPKEFSKRIFTGGYVIGNSCFASYYHDCKQSGTNITCFGANCPACMPFHLTFNLIELQDSISLRAGDTVPDTGNSTGTGGSSSKTTSRSLAAIATYYSAIIGFILLVSWVFFILLLRCGKMLAVGLKMNFRKQYTEGEWPDDEPKSKLGNLMRTPSFVLGKMRKNQKSTSDVEREFSSENSADKAGRKVSPFMGRRKRYTKRKPEGALLVKEPKPVHVTDHPETVTKFANEVCEIPNQEPRAPQKVRGKSKRKQIAKRQKH